MCGIFFAAHLDVKTAVFAVLCETLRNLNAARGPDSQSSEKKYLRRSSGPVLCVDFYGSELRLRGDKPIVQPHVRGDDVFCWNGEIFEGLDVGAEENDGTKLFDTILGISSPENLPQIFGNIEGPYAFLYYHAASRRVFFARDPLGRRSLLIHKPSVENPFLLISSVSAGSDDRYDFEEVSTQSIFSINLEHLSTTSDIVTNFESCMSTIPRFPTTWNPSAFPFAALQGINQELPGSPLGYDSKSIFLGDIPSYLTQAADNLITHLDRSVMLRVRNIPRNPNETEKSHVAVLFSGGIDCAIVAFLAHRHLPENEPIDLLNVSFENPRKLQAQLKGKRAQNIPLESDLNPDWVVPDRLSGMDEVEELRRLCKGRTWNFIEINVSYKLSAEESQSAREIIGALMWPSRTVMDLSLAMALYFASRGVGLKRDRVGDTEATDYTSPARVLLSGLGSDELLGGYARHRTVFKEKGWEGVINELQLEIDRLPTRNLGRDDRVISSHGKETRFPFLSLSLVSFLAGLPVHYKMDPRLGAGLGDKLLLRLAARKLGMVEASARIKKAMQFGSCSARMESDQTRQNGDVLL